MSKLSDSTPTFTPAPVNPSVLRSTSARSAASPWPITERVRYQTGRANDVHPGQEAVAVENRLGLHEVHARGGLLGQRHLRRVGQIALRVADKSGATSNLQGQRYVDLFAITAPTEAGYGPGRSIGVVLR